MRQVLKLPAFRRLLSAYSLNELAFWIGSIALSILVYRRTGSAFAAAGYFLSAQFLPALLSPFVVARLDQLAARWVLAVLYALEALVFVLLAWLASRFSLVPVLAVAALDGVLALSARALSRAASVMATSPHGLLREGNAISNTAFSLAFVAGPALGGAVVSGAGIRTALFADAGVLAVVTLTLLTSRSLPRPSGQRAPSAGRLRAALAYARSRPMIRALLGLQAAAIVFFAVSIPVEVVFATHTLHAGAGGLGAIGALWGVGALAGSGLYVRFRHAPAWLLISSGAGSLAVGFAVMAVAPGLAVALVGAALAGLGNGLEAVAARTALQEQTDETWMGMMMSLNESTQQAAPGAGILLGGAIAALANPRVAFAVAGAGALAIAIVTSTLLSSRIGRAVAETPTG